MYGPALYRINKALIECAANVKPDLVLIFAGMPIWPATIKNLRRDFWVAGYHNDDPFGSNGDRSYFRIFKAHPGLLWVPPRCCGGETGVEVQSGGVEVDCGSVVLAVSVAVCHSFEFLDLCVEGFWNGVSDPVS